MLHVDAVKSVGEQPSIVSVYTVWHFEGRSDTRGLKSARLTAKTVAGSASSAKVDVWYRIAVRYYRLRGCRFVVRISAYRQILWSVARVNTAQAVCY